jgi:hypothetical protein
MANSSQKTISCRPYPRNINLKPILAKGKEEEEKKAAYRVTEDIVEKYTQRLVIQRLKCCKLYCI